MRLVRTRAFSQICVHACARVLQRPGDGFARVKVLIAKELKVDKKKFCWARLFTTKQGADADAICTDKSHDAAAHTPPPKFNREALAKEYSSNATAAQCKAAGWFSLPKKAKT